MRGRDHDSPTERLTEYPDDFENGRLVGVNKSGLPVYFEPADQRAREVVETDGDLEPREPRWDGPIESIIDDIEDAIGWESLSDYGEENKQD